MAVITTGLNPKLLWPGLNKIWGLAYNKNPKQWSLLFDSFTSDKAYEEDVSMTGMGLTPVKPESASLIYGDQKQAYVSRYSNLAYAIGYIISRENIADNQYAQVGAMRTRSLAFSMVQTKENVGADVYNRAFNAAYPGGDGVSLINAAHPTEGGLLSNTLTVAADLSEAALEDALIDIKLFRDNRNLRIGVMANSLVVPPALEFEATRITKNRERPGTADRDISAINYMGLLPGGIICNQYFTDTKAWFLRTNCPDSLKHFERQKAIFENDNDFDTKNAKFSGYERYVFGWSDWRGIYASPGA